MVTVFECTRGIPREKIEGRRIGNLELARYLFMLEVEEDAYPPLGTSWYREDDNGVLYLWKENWDTSD